MSYLRKPIRASDVDPLHGPKTRKCLVCKVAFPSEWAGERVCASCKKKMSWKQGLRK